MDTSLVVTGGVVFGIGAVTLGIALKVQRDHRRWCAGKTRVRAVISRIAARRTGSLSEDASGMSAEPGEIAVPMARFRATNGVEYEVEAREAPSEVGAAVEVAYDPAMPSDGRGVERVPKVGLCILLLVVGAILIGVGASRAG